MKQEKHLLLKSVAIQNEMDAWQLVMDYGTRRNLGKIRVISPVKSRVGPQGTKANLNCFPPNKPTFFPSSLLAGVAAAAASAWAPAPVDGERVVLLGFIGLGFFFIEAK